MLAFLAPPGAGADRRPRQSLVDFRKVVVGADEAVVVTFDVRARDLTLVDSTGVRFRPAGVWTLRVEGAEAEIEV